ncbi:unnamed protein product [Symbiodinium sp. CCMP2456]|nr:unnamed protein product [Symbiodinium sp. CCMP2456]
MTCASVSGFLRTWAQVLPTPNRPSISGRKVVQRMARACLAVVIASGGLAFGLGETCVEENSLMQQKLKAPEDAKAPFSFLQTASESSHSPESLGELTEGLKKMAKKGSKLDESPSGALDGIRKQMDKIKKDTLDDHHTAIKQLNALYDAITSCMAPSSSKPKAAKDKLAGQHDTCRGEEVAPVECEKLRGWSMKLSQRPRSPASRSSTTGVWGPCNMGVSENRGPKDSTLNNRILNIKTPK